MDCIALVPSDEEDPSRGVAVDCIPTGRPDREDPSLGLTGGGLDVRGLSSQGSLVVDVVERAVFIDGGR